MGLAGRGRGLAVSLMGSRWRVLSRGLTDSDYDQLFLVTSFRLAAHVHNGLSASNRLIGWLKSEYNLPPC